ncbi:MAG: hypothetical protein AAGB01_04745 [Cyanobacteria bacterium P01_F01_bin.42]
MALSPMNYLRTEFWALVIYASFLSLLALGQPSFTCSGTGGAKCVERGQQRRLAHSETLDAGINPTILHTISTEIDDSSPAEQIYKQIGFDDTFDDVVQAIGALPDYRYQAMRFRPSVSAARYQILSSLHSFRAIP